MPDRILRKLTAGRVRLGPKRIALLALGVLATIRGISYIDPPIIPDGLSTLHQVAPLTWWAIVWVIIGLLAVAGSFTRHYRSALVPLLVITGIWCGSYAAEWCMEVFVRGGWSRDYVTVVSYASQAVLILALIRLIDPSEVTPHAGRGRADDH